jgi:hypothetical protein
MMIIPTVRMRIVPDKTAIGSAEFAVDLEPADEVDAVLPHTNRLKVL